MLNINLSRDVFTEDHTEKLTLFGTADSGDEFTVELSEDGGETLVEVSRYDMDGELIAAKSFYLSSIQ